MKTHSIIKFHKSFFLPILIGFLLFSTNLFSASRYWVGGTGTWDASSTTNWSSTSGGASGASVPTSSDDIFFNGSSFTANNQTVTIAADVNCLSMSWTGATTTFTNPTLTFSSSMYDLNVYGSLTLNSGMTFTSSGSWLFFRSTSTGRTITTAGKTLPVAYFSGSGGAWTFQDAFSTSTKSVYITNGTVNTNNLSLTCGSFNLSGGTFNPGTSTISPTSVTVSGGSWTFGANVTNSGSTTISSGTLNTNGFTFSTTSLTVSGGTATFGASTITTPYLNVSSGTLNLNSANVNLTGSSSSELTLSSTATVPISTSTITFTGVNNSGSSPIEVYLGLKTVYNLVFSTGTYSINFFDGGTAYSINLPSTSWTIFESGKTFTFSNTFTTTATCQTYSLLTSSISGTASTVSLPETAMSFIQIKDITNSGTSTTCTSCVNAGTNSGFTFTSPYSARTLYWRGNTTRTGNWGTGSNWTENSDGTSSGNSCVPTIIDAVIFDATSFDAGGHTLTIDQRATAASINFTGTANSPTITNTSSYDILTTGNLTLASTIGTITNSGGVYLIGTTNQLITCGTKKLSSGTTYFSNPSTIYLEDDGYFGTVNIKNGTLDVQNQAASTVNNLYFSGDWYLSGTFQPRSNSSKYTIFNGASDGSIYNNTTFYNLKLNCTGFYSLETSANVTITNELLIAGGMYENTNSKTTTVGGSVNLTSATSTSCYLYISSGTFSYLNNSLTNFNIANGDIWAWGGTLNIGVAGSQTTTVMNIGDGTTTAGQSELDISGGTVNIVDQLLIMYDGILDVSSGTLNIKTNTTNGGTAGTSKFQINSSGQFKQSGGTINILGAADNNTTNAISFNTGSTFTSGNITGGTVVLKSTTSTYDYPVDFGGKTLYNLTTNQSGRTFKQVNNSLIVKGNFTITDGTYNSNALAMSVAGNWTNNGTFTSNSNTITLNGSSVQTINGTSTTTFYNLTNSNSSTGLTLNTGIVVTNTLSMSGATADINLNGFNIDLSSTGEISGETNNDRIYGTSGVITTTRTLNNINALNVGGMGVLLTSASDLGATTIDRGHSSQSINGVASLLRYYSITPTTNTGLNATLIYNYFDKELNGLSTDEANFVLYRSTNSGVNWTNRNGAVNTASNTISLSEIDAFSLWVGAVNAVSLPIELISFSGKKARKSNELIWTTASERNNDYFTIEKTLDGEIFEIVGFENGAGSSNTSMEYKMNDHNVSNTINYYRLKQTDFDGKYDFSEMISIDNREKDTLKEIRLITNVLGQIVNDEYSGMVIVNYTDGSSIKTFR